MPPTLTNRDCIKMLQFATREMMRDIRGLRYYEWVTDRYQMSIFSSIMELCPSVDRIEILRNRTPHAFVSLLKTRIFSHVSDVYESMVEAWGLKPRFFIPEPASKEFEDGFIA